MRSKKTVKTRLHEAYARGYNLGYTVGQERGRVEGAQARRKIVATEQYIRTAESRIAMMKTLAQTLDATTHAINNLWGF